MANKKPKEKHKKKISFALNEKVLDKMDEYLEEEGIPKRSRYIEKLIRDDMEKRGKNVDREF
jgi:metal-responsive CopG/Arc/MetJ family transcriptional regulator